MGAVRERAAELRECIQIMGGLMRSSDRTDPRIDRPLAQQLGALVDSAVASKPEFWRTVPVRWDDTDILICSVLAKLLDLASAGLLVDDDTARLVALGKAAEAMRAQFPAGCAANASHVTFGYVACLDAIYREAGINPEDGR